MRPRRPAGDRRSDPPPDPLPRHHPAPGQQRRSARRDPAGDLPGVAAAPQEVEPVSRAKGNQAPAWIAAYLQRWWPGCEKTPNGRRGRDLLGTLGVAIEIKTGAQLRTAWLDQAMSYAACDGDGPHDSDCDRSEVPLLIWLREGQGEKSVPKALALLALPLDEMMAVLEDSGWAPRPHVQMQTQGNMQ